MSSKTVTTWYYNEQRLSLSHCQLYFQILCKYNFRYTWNFPGVLPYEYLFDNSLARSEKNSCAKIMRQNMHVLYMYSVYAAQTKNHKKQLIHENRDVSNNTAVKVCRQSETSFFIQWSVHSVFPFESWDYWQFHSKVQTVYPPLAHFLTY